MNEECGKAFYSCACTRPLDHVGAHRCECEGSWTDDGDIINLPQPQTTEQAFMMMGLEFLNESVSEEE